MTESISDGLRRFEVGYIDIDGEFHSFFQRACYFTRFFAERRRRSAERIDVKIDVRHPVRYVVVDRQPRP